MNKEIRIDKIKVLKLLAKRRWTYADLANEMGLTRQLVSLHLMGRRNIRLTTLYQFADALQVEAIELLKERGEDVDN